MAYRQITAFVVCAAFLGLCSGAREAWCNISSTSGRSSDPIEGTVFFSQQTKDSHVTLTVDLRGFNATDSYDLHGFHVHASPDLADGCVAAGGHYNPLGMTHGGPTDDVRHVGDLGNVQENNQGEVKTTITDGVITLDGEYSILQRAIVVHEKEDDLGKGGAVDSNTTGAAGARLGCCVITAVAGSSFETSGANPGVTPTALGLGLLLLLVAALLQ